MKQSFVIKVRFQASTSARAYKKVYAKKKGCEKVGNRIFRKGVSYNDRSAKSNVLETALHQDSTFFFLSASCNTGWKVVTFSFLWPEEKISSSVQTPTANPAAQAAPRAVVSISAGLTTGLPSKSACKSSSKTWVQKEIMTMTITISSQLSKYELMRKDAQK